MCDLDAWLESRSDNAGLLSAADDEDIVASGKQLTSKQEGDGAGPARIVRLPVAEQQEPHKDRFSASTTSCTSSSTRTGDSGRLSVRRPMDVATGTCSGRQPRAAW